MAVGRAGKHRRVVPSAGRGPARTSGPVGLTVLVGLVGLALLVAVAVVAVVVLR